MSSLIRCCLNGKKCLLYKYLRASLKYPPINTEWYLLLRTGVFLQGKSAHSEGDDSLGDRSSQFIGQLKKFFSSANGENTTMRRNSGEDRMRKGWRTYRRAITLLTCAFPANLAPVKVREDEAAQAPLRELLALHWRHRCNATTATLEVRLTLVTQGLLVG